MKREKTTGPGRILAGQLGGLEKSDFCDFEKPRKRAYQKGNIKFHEQSKEEGQPKLVYRKERGARHIRNPWRSRHFMLGEVLTLYDVLGHHFLSWTISGQCDYP